MDDDNEVLDWGNEDDEQNQDGPRSVTPDDDQDDAVSLGDEDSIEEPPATQLMRSDENDVQKQLSDPGHLDLPAELDSAPTAATGDTVITQNDPSQQARASPVSSRLTHALPPKPVVAGVPAVTPSAKATSMKASTARARKANGTSPSAGRGSTTDHDLPPDWEIRHSRKGEPYFYNNKTHDSIWERPSASASDRELKGDDVHGKDGAAKVPSSPVMPRRTSQAQRSPARRSSRDETHPSRGNDQLSVEDRYYRPSESGRAFDRVEDRLTAAGESSRDNPPRREPEPVSAREQPGQTRGRERERERGREKVADSPPSTAREGRETASSRSRRAPRAREEPSYPPPPQVDDRTPSERERRDIGRNSPPRQPDSHHYPSRSEPITASRHRSPSPPHRSPAVQREVRRDARKPSSEVLPPAPAKRKDRPSRFGPTKPEATHLKSEPLGSRQRSPEAHTGYRDSEVEPVDEPPSRSKPVAQTESRRSFGRDDYEYARGRPSPEYAQSNGPIRSLSGSAVASPPYTSTQGRSDGESRHSDRDPRASYRRSPSPDIGILHRHDIRAPENELTRARYTEALEDDRRPPREISSPVQTSGLRNLRSDAWPPPVNSTTSDRRPAREQYLDTRGPPRPRAGRNLAQTDTQPLPPVEPDRRYGEDPGSARAPATGPIRSGHGYDRELPTGPKAMISPVERSRPLSPVPPSRPAADNSRHGPADTTPRLPSNGSSRELREPRGRPPVGKRPEFNSRHASGTNQIPLKSDRYASNGQTQKVLPPDPAPPVRWEHEPEVDRRDRLRDERPPSSARQGYERPPSPPVAPHREHDIRPREREPEHAKRRWASMEYDDHRPEPHPRQSELDQRAPRRAPSPPPQDYDSRRANAYSVPPHMVSSSTAAYDRPPYEPRRHSRERPERHVRAPVKPEPRRQQDDGYKPRPPRPISPPPPEKVYEPLEADMEIDRVWDTGSPPSSERGRTSAHPHSPTRGRGHGFVHPLPPKPSHTAFTELPTGADDQGRRGRRNSPLGKITRAVFPAGLLEEEILEIQRSVGLAPGSPVAVRQRAPEQLGDVDMGPLHVDERRVWQDRDRGQREWGREKEWERERLPPPRRERSPHSRGSLLERMNGLVGNPGPNEVEDDRQPPVVSSNTLRDRVSVPSKRDHDEVGHSGAESCGPPDGELPKRRRRARDAKSKKGHVRR